jgi:hypothetical protein
MFEIEPEMLSRGGLVFVDGTEACTREAGEFQNYSGQLAEVGSFCGNGADEGAAKKAWEEAGGDLTIFKSGLSLLLLLPWNRSHSRSRSPRRRHLQVDSYEGSRAWSWGLSTFLIHISLTGSYKVFGRDVDNLSLVENMYCRMKLIDTVS